MKSTNTFGIQFIIRVPKNEKATEAAVYLLPYWAVASLPMRESWIASVRRPDACLPKCVALLWWCANGHLFAFYRLITVLPHHGQIDYHFNTIFIQRY
jgi:hypothetical protein